MDTQLSLIKAALAALSQKAVHEPDINYAKRCLRDAIRLSKSKARANVVSARLLHATATPEEQKGGFTHKRQTGA